MSQEVGKVSDLTVEVLKAIRAELQGLRTETVQGFAAVRGEVSEMRVQLQELTEYTQAGFTAVLAQGDRRFLDHEGRLRRLEQHAGFEPTRG